ncbi:MAG TPA: NADP-dependent oxidoreductase [Candidatus Acidoferrum sp.]|nr:NADP-dependent oxidoreductase [Candidatus Acidoferrum sp.]
MPPAEQVPSTNRQITLAARPVGLPKESDFALLESPLPQPGRGEALIQSLYLSVDPYMYGRVKGPTQVGKSVQVGEVMMGGVVGRVMASNDPRFAPEDIVEGMLGWQEYAVAPAKALRKIDTQVAPITTALYVLGMPGLTAFFGLLQICKPQAGETVVVSGAAGAVGSLVGQIAKIKRCHAIGIVGSREKVDFVTRELGFDAAINYRETDTFGTRLKELAPNGVDVYFDNVGGSVTDEVMRHLSNRARISVCGQSSQYTSPEPDIGPRWLGQLVARQARAEGFLVTQFADRYEPALKQLTVWLREGKLRYREDIMDGLENAPRAFIGMLQGKNIGKELVNVGARQDG